MKYFIEEETLKDIANSIRSKAGISDSIGATEMSAAIDSISGEGEVLEILDEYTPGACEFYTNWDKTATDIQDKYKGNENLVYLPPVDWSNVINATSAFSECPNLKYISKNFLNSCNSNLEAVGLFSSCNAITEIKNINWYVGNAIQMFAECENLETVENVTIHAANQNAVGLMFNNCPNLKTVKNLQIIIDNADSNIWSIFENCVNLETIENFQIDEKNDAYQHVFYNCQKLKTIPVLPVSNASSYGLNQDTFYNCFALTDESLDNILQTCINFTPRAASTHPKTLYYLGFRNNEYFPASRIQALPHYQEFYDAGWRIGY